MHMEPDNDRALLWILTFSEPFLIIDWALYGQKSVFMLHIYVWYTTYIIYKFTTLTPFFLSVCVLCSPNNFGSHENVHSSVW